MEKIVCKKPCRFGGRDFYIGDEIPRELVDPERLPSLVKYGFISVQIASESDGDGETANHTMTDAETPQKPSEAAQSETEQHTSEAKSTTAAKATVKGEKKSVGRKARQ